MIVTLSKPSILHWDSVPSPVGDCVVIATEAGVCWAGTPGTPVDDGIARATGALQIEHIVRGGECLPLQQAMDELRRYLGGSVCRSPACGICTARHYRLQCGENSVIFPMARLAAMAKLPASLGVKALRVQ